MPTTEVFKSVCERKAVKFLQQQDGEAFNLEDVAAELADQLADKYEDYEFMFAIAQESLITVFKNREHFLNRAKPKKKLDEKEVSFLSEYA